MKPTQLAWAALLVGVIVLALAVALVVVGDQKGWLTPTARTAIALPITAVASAFLGCAAVAAANKLIDEDDDSDDEDAYGNKTAGNNESGLLGILNIVKRAFKGDSVTPETPDPYPSLIPSKKDLNAINVSIYPKKLKYEPYKLAPNDPNKQPLAELDPTLSDHYMDLLETLKTNRVFRKEFLKFLVSEHAEEQLQFIDYAIELPKSTHKERLYRYKILINFVDDAAKKALRAFMGNNSRRRDNKVVPENNSFDSSNDETDIPDINLRSDTLNNTYNALSRAIEAIKDGLSTGSMPEMLDEESTAEAILEDVCKQLTQMIAIDKKYARFYKILVDKKYTLGSAQKTHQTSTTRSEPGSGVDTARVTINEHPHSQTDRAPQSVWNPRDASTPSGVEQTPIELFDHQSSA